ncbi:MAG: PD40 domain-containing protein [Sedimentisphaerales bacterium]|nr:PD40 domain-containing protein [Sedimentisphaerales bacterium]
MKKQFSYLILFCVTVLGIILWLILSEDTITIENYRSVSRMPVIKPDYTEIVLPPNIAPLNFMILEPGTQYLVEIHSATGKPIKILSKTSKIKIPLRQWKSLLNANRGRQLFFDVYVKNKNSLWNRYETITNTIAQDDIDGYLAYRFMKPLFNYWINIGIYQRNLGNYKNKEILNSKRVDRSCLNCHTFLNNTPEYMTIGIRGSTHGAFTLFAGDGKVNKIGLKWGYTTWHPSGKLAAYSANKVRQFFHDTTMEIRDVIDLDSVIYYYTVDNQKIKTIPAISEKDRLETYPTWSPDGQYLYFCSAPILWTDRDEVPPRRYAEVKYDLRRISYNLETDKWGPSETVLSAEETGMSILCPRISPDGSFLVFCMCDYGCFPVFQPSSDLYLMDLRQGIPTGPDKYTKLPVNSEYSESWHSFSSNSRWLSFSSKKRDGLFTRIYFTHIDENGHASKPFILPQKDPAYHDSLLQTYSVPELITQPVKVSKTALTKAVRGKADIEPDLPFTGATPKAEQSDDPWLNRE